MKIENKLKVTSNFLLNCFVDHSSLLFSQPFYFGVVPYILTSLLVLK